MSSRFFFSFLFILWLGLFYINKKNFKILDIHIQVKRPLDKLHLNPQWGPDTHNSPQQRGAKSKAKQPLFVQKNHLKNYQKLPNLWFNIQSLP